MADFDPTAAQSGVLDEQKADPVRKTETGILAKREDGTMFEVDAEGEISDVTEGQPEPITGDPEDIADADDFKPTSTDLEVIDFDDLPRAMDRADEVMILDELQGRALDVWVYSFESEGKLQTDLTVHGVNETVRVMNERGGTKIGVSEATPLIEQFTEGEKRFYRAMVYALDRRSGVGHWGMAIEPVMMKLKRGGTKWDKFAQTKALNKAERNAQKKHIPEEFRQHLIAQAIGAGKVKTLEPAQSRKVIEDKPVLNDEKAEAIKKEIREAYAELKDLNRMAIPPGQYQIQLSQAERESHTKLEEFRDSIVSALEHERKAAEQAEQKAAEKAAEAS